MWFLICWWVAWAIIATFVGTFFDGGDLVAGIATFLLGGVFASALVAVLISGNTNAIGQDHYTLVSNEKIYYGHDSSQNIKVVHVYGSTGTGEELNGRWT